MRGLVVATISDQPDIEIVGVLEDQASILGMVEQLDIRSNRIENSEESILSALRGRKLVVSTLPEPESSSRAN